MSLFLVIAIITASLMVIGMIAAKIRHDIEPWPALFLIPLIPFMTLGIIDQTNRNQINSDLKDQGFELAGVDGMSSQADIWVDGIRYHCDLDTNPNGKFIISSIKKCDNMSETGSIQGGITPKDLKEDKK